MKVISRSKKDFEKVFSYLENIKPDYGTLTMNFIYHQRELSKVRLLQREDVIVLEKPKVGQMPKKEEKYEKSL